MKLTRHSLVVWELTFTVHSHCVSGGCHWDMTKVLVAFKPRMISSMALWLKNSRSRNTWILHYHCCLVASSVLLEVCPSVLVRGSNLPRKFAARNAHFSTQLLQPCSIARLWSCDICGFWISEAVHWAIGCLTISLWAQLVYTQLVVTFVITETHICRIAYISSITNSTIYLQVCMLNTEISPQSPL